MSRPPRFTYPGALHHVTLRCNNREFLFTPDSQAAFLGTVQEMRATFPLSLFSYCVMTNHVHLVFQVRREDTLSRSMHWLSTTFVRRFNRRHGRKGHLWEGRFRSTVIERHSYFFRCMAYVDLNPVRAGIVATPDAYAWSAHTALRAEDAAVLDFHPDYQELATAPAARYEAYREFVQEESTRPPHSLATAYFAGTRRFVRRMGQRFRCDERGLRLSVANAGSGHFVSSPKRGPRLCQDPL